MLNDEKVRSLIARSGLLFLVPCELNQSNFGKDFCDMRHYALRKNMIRLKINYSGASGFVGGFSADESRLDRHQGGAD